jgi:hypothetical protein
MPETPRDITIIIEASLRESLNEVASSHRPESFGFPRCESPANDYFLEPGPASEGGVRGSDEKWGVKDELKNGSLTLLGV